jgi:hypothetical protein
MIRIYLSFLFIVCSHVCFGQGNAAMQSLQVPAGNRLAVHTYAKGVQIYICTQDANDSSKFTWILKEPKAQLYTDSTYKHLAGKHYFTDGKKPAWESNDGSKVIGAKLLQINSTDGAGIPWLLLKANQTSGNGILTPVTFIQRINTKGGKAPIAADNTQKGQLMEVPYTAEYLFYSKN